MPASVDELLTLLDLETIDLNLFRGSPSRRRHVQRVFGGQVAAQALVAANRTVPTSTPVHSLHSYFLRPGDTAVPIVYDVDRVRDGRSLRDPAGARAPARRGRSTTHGQLPGRRGRLRAPGHDAGRARPPSEAFDVNAMLRAAASAREEWRAEWSALRPAARR